VKTDLKNHTEIKLKMSGLSKNHIRKIDYFFTVHKFPSISTLAWYRKDQHGCSCKSKW